MSSWFSGISLYCLSHPLYIFWGPVGFFTTASLSSHVNCGFKVFHPQVDFITRKLQNREEINQAVGEKLVERLRNYRYFRNTLLPWTYTVHLTNAPCLLNSGCLKAVGAGLNSQPLKPRPPASTKIVRFNCRTR